MSTATRKSTSMSLDADLLEEARSLGLNLSKSAESGIAAAVKQARARQFKEENAEAFRSYNQWIEDNGIPLARYRKLSPQ